MSAFKCSFIAASLIMFLFFSCTPKKETKNLANPEQIDYSVRSSMPHDPKAFTQGFVIHEGKLFESTGQSGSWIGIVDVKTGVADKKIKLDSKYFGEGITILNNKIYQLTWTTHTGFVYSLDSFKVLNQFKYDTEGWGITHNGENLVMSDGSNKLYFLDTVNFSVVKTMEVKYNDAPVRNLNELEYVDGFIFANVWETNWIAKIDASNGEVEGFLDMSLIANQVKSVNPAADVLNGIAWHEGTKSLLVTGKYWPYIYILKLSEKPV